MESALFDAERARGILDEEEIDILVACRPENFTYISGVARPLEHRYVREHTTFALLGRDGKAALVVPFFELETVQEETWVADVVPFRQFADSPTDGVTAGERGGSPEAVAAGKISQMGHREGRIGFDEKYTPLHVHETLLESLPGAEFVPATRVFERLRAVKTPSEIARISASARIVEKAYLAMWQLLSEGVTERQLAQVAMEVIVGEGARWLSFMNCGAGVRSSREHFPPSDYSVQTSDLVRFDFGVCLQGYHADIGRTFAIAPTAEQRKVYGDVFHAYEQTIAAMKPGATGAEVYATYRREMGEYFRVTPLEWVGHGYGLELHEAPFLGPLMNDPLEPGMVFAVEIVLNFQDREGYHVEDPILITESGNQRLIELPNDSLVV